MNRVISGFLKCVLALGGFAIATNPAYAADEPIVIEDLSPAELRAEIEKVQNEFFRVFNIANEEDELDITCREYTPSMTHIKETACEPNFLIDARARNAENARRGTDELLSTIQLRAEHQQDFERLTAAMNEVMKTNNYFRELNGVLSMLRARLAEISR